MGMACTEFSLEPFTEMTELYQPMLQAQSQQALFMALARRQNAASNHLHDLFTFRMKNRNTGVRKLINFLQENSRRNMPLDLPAKLQEEART